MPTVYQNTDDADWLKQCTKIQYVQGRLAGIVSNEICSVLADPMRMLRIRIINQGELADLDLPAKWPLK